MTDDPFDQAVDALFAAPFTAFVDERKRLAGELKAAGLKLPAQRLAAINRPPVSVWAVNQLYRHARTELDALFAAAAKIRDGDLGATGIHREVLADLRERAAELLRADGSAANEPTLRRIAQTLQALAAAGSFEPDAPGQLTTDRDPPGFEALAGLVGGPSVPAPAQPVAKPPRATTPKASKADTEEAKAAKAEAARIKQEADDAAKARAAHRRTLEAQVRTSQRSLDGATRELDAARAAVVAANERVGQAETALATAQAAAGEAKAALDAHDAGSST